MGQSPSAVPADQIKPESAVLTRCRRGERNRRREGKKPRFVSWGAYSEERSKLGFCRLNAIRDFDYISKEMLLTLADRDKMIEEQKLFQQCARPRPGSPPPACPPGFPGTRQHARACCSHAHAHSATTRLRASPDVLLGRIPAAGTRTWRRCPTATRRSSRWARGSPTTSTTRATSTGRRSRRSTRRDGTAFSRLSPSHASSGTAPHVAPASRLTKATQAP